MRAPRLAALARPVALRLAQAWRRARSRRPAKALDAAVDELAAAHAELATAHAELTRRKAFTDALLETIDVGIVSCDAEGVFVVSNRAEREIFGLEAGLEGLSPEELHPLIKVSDPEGRFLSSESYPLMRALRGEDVSSVDVLVGPDDGPRREVVVRAHRMTGPDGAVLGAVAALTDVTVERAAMRALSEERRRLAEAQRLGQLGGFDHDVRTGAWTFSDQLCAIWGVAPGTLTSETAQSLIADEDRAVASHAWATAVRVAGSHGFEFRIHRASDGAERVLRVRLEVSLDDGGLPVHARGTHLDVTDLEVAQKAARRANAFSDAVLAASPDTTVVTDLATGAIIYVSPGKEVLGFAVDTFKDLGPAAVAMLVHPDDRTRVAAFHAAGEHLADGQTQQQRYRTTDAAGQTRWLDHCLTPFRRDRAGAVVELLGVVRDVTDLVLAEDLLLHAARHDSLTGLPNRALLIETLEGALERSRTDGREVAVLFIDLDGFKGVNDTGGHSAGDVVLQVTARRLRHVLRSADTVARVGGDEFVIIVEPGYRPGDVAEPGGPEQVTEPVRALAVQVAERITESLGRPITVRGLDHVVTASIGITYATLDLAAPSGGVTVDDVLHRADAAMYQAKSLGKNRYEILELTEP